MNDKRLLIVGASVRAAAFSARRSGFDPECADLFADADLTALCNAVAVANYPDDLQAIIEQSASNEWIYTGALENRPDLLNNWAKSKCLLGNAAETVPAIRNPFVLQDCLKRNGLPTPCAKSELATTDNQSQWIRKPFSSASGLDVEIASSETPRDGVEYFFQEFIQGDPQSAVFVGAKQQAQFLGATKQLIGTDWCGVEKFRYAGSIGPIGMESNEFELWNQIGSKLAAEFDLKGLFGVDAIVNDDGIWTIEVNPRYTASIEILESADPNVNSIYRHVTACRNQMFVPFRQREQIDVYYAKAILFAKRPLCVSPALVDRLLRENERSDLPRIADIPHAGTIEAGWPILTVFGKGDSLTKAENDAKNRVLAIKASLESSNLIRP